MQKAAETAAKPNETAEEPVVHDADVTDEKKES